MQKLERHWDMVWAGRWVHNSQSGRAIAVATWRCEDATPVRWLLHDCLVKVGPTGLHVLLGIACSLDHHDGNQEADVSCGTTSASHRIVREVLRGEGGLTLIGMLGLLEGVNARPPLTIRYLDS